MKKITFALACASTCALFADWSNTIGFEEYTAPFTGLSVKTDAGGTGNAFWLYEGASGSDDGSTVKAYVGEDTLAAPTGTSLSGDAGNNYLELSTEGGTLWRSLNQLTKDGEDDVIGAPQAVGEGLYIDTMVQFTPTEDETEPDTYTDKEDGNKSDKLAIWLQKGADEVCTLKVKCGQLKFGTGDLVTDAATFSLARADGEPLKVAPGNWYRLTVKSIANIDTSGAYYMPVFMIYLDGKQLACVSDTNTSDEELVSALAESLSIPADDLNAGKVFPSLVQLDNFSLTGVGFKGSGAVDALSISDTDPLPAGPAAPDVPFSIAAEGLTIDGWALKADAESWTAYAAGAVVPAGTEKVYIKITNADGASKIVEKAIGETNEFDLAAETFGWAEYLGAAVAYGEGTAWGIDDAAELDMFKKGFDAGLETVGQTFVLTANVALTAPWAGIGTYKDGGGSASAFKGTFDGQDFKVSALTFASGAINNYRGFFNQLEGATVKNLTVSGTVFGDGTGFTGEYGGAMIAGNAVGSTIENCTSEGTIAAATHNAAGIVVRMNNATIKNCTNKANITGSYSKIGGIAVLNQGSTTACLIEGCVNEGTVTASGTYDKTKDEVTTTYAAGTDGIGGILAYCADAKMTIKDCWNKGQIVQAQNAAVRLGQIIGWEATALAAVQGTNKGLATILAIGDGKKSGLNYATVADGVATYVADTAVIAGADLLVTTKGNEPAIELTDDQTITFDIALATIKETGITAGEGFELADATVDGTKKTFSVKVPATEPEYPEYIGAEDDDAKAKFDAWVESVAGVGFDRAAEVATPQFLEAYLLNVAPNQTAVDAAKAEFKITSITVEADGTVTIVAPTAAEKDYNGTVEIHGSATVNGEYAPKTGADWGEDIRFFKAILK